MKTLSLDFSDAVTHADDVQSDDELSWLGDLSPGLTAAKSIRFITQTIIGIAVVAGFLIFI